MITILQALSEWTRMGPQKRVESIKSFATRMTKTKEVKEVNINSHVIFILLDLKNEKIHYTYIHIFF